MSGKTSLYTEPSWAAPPGQATTGFQLEVIKEGVSQEVLDLSSRSSFFFFGRQDDAVDFVLAHPSISRVHAVAQYRNDGALLLLDLQSAQGTYVNKKRLEEGIYERLYVGDVIRFGASTRHYIVNGPDEHALAEYDSENLRAYRQRLAEQNQDAARRIKAQDEVSWGMGTGEEIGAGADGNDDENDDLPSYLKNDPSFRRKQSNVREDEFGSSDKDKALLEKIRAKELKIEQLEGENRKIQHNAERGGTGLSSGQSAAMTRNDHVIAKLENEIAELLRTHRERNSGSGSPRGTAAAADDDDLLDETFKYSDASTNWRLKKRQQQPANHQQKQTEVWTYEGLLSARAANQSKIAALASVKSAVEAGHIVDEEEDESSRVLAAEMRKDVQAQLTKIALEKQALEINDARLAALLNIAEPGLGHTQTIVPREEIKMANHPPAPAGPQQAPPVPQQAKRSLQGGGVSDCLKMLSSEASSTGLKRKAAAEEKEEHADDGSKAKKTAMYDELDTWVPPPSAGSGEKDRLGY